jgi:hypothetical protein
MWEIFMSEQSLMKNEESSEKRADVKRITADFSPEAYEALERVAKNLNTTNKADALRRALGLIDFVLTEQKKDGYLLSKKMIKEGK